MKRIGNYAFNGWKGLAAVEIPATLEEIGDACFSVCSSLSHVTFAGGSALRRIGNKAFGGCSLLKNIEIPGIESAPLRIGGDIGL